MTTTSAPVAMRQHASGRVVRFVRTGFLGMALLIVLEAALTLIFFWFLASSQKALTNEALPALSTAQSLVRQVKLLDREARALIASAEPFAIEGHLLRVKAQTDELRLALASHSPARLKPEVNAELASLLDAWDTLLNRLSELQQQRVEAHGRATETKARLLSLYRQIDAAKANAPSGSARQATLEALGALMVAGAIDDPAELAPLRQRFESRLTLLRGAHLDAELRQALDDGVTTFGDRSRLLRIEHHLQHMAERLVILDRLVAIVEDNARMLSHDAQTQAEASEIRLLWMMTILLSISIASIALAAVVMILVNRRILFRLQELQRVMQGRVRGTAEPIPLGGHDEITDMACSFAHFVDKVDTHEAQLEKTISHLNEAVAVIETKNEELKQSDRLKAELNQSLEQKVRERTQQLEAALVAQKNSNETALRVQTQLAQSEKMAALGVLIAGVTHEINTPIGAIKSSGGSITEALGETLNKLPTLFQTLDGDSMGLFLELLNRANAPRAALNSREERAIKREAARELEDSGIVNANQKAGILVQLNAHLALARYLPLLRHPASDLILDTAGSVAAVISSSSNINIAVERVAKIVRALKSFSRVNQSAEMSDASVQDGLETVLTIYNYEIKQTTTVVRNYDAIPPLRCLPDELNQVWTNLIHNALQAMDSEGTRDRTLTIGIHRVSNETGDHAVVSVTDSGSGIPEDIRDKIFDVFFTTKPAGIGSGLGLDIVKKIVDKHQGRIEVQSEVGVGTTFLVYLPYVGKAA